MADERKPRSYGSFAKRNVFISFNYDEIISEGDDGFHILHGPPGAGKTAVLKARILSLAGAGLFGLGERKAGAHIIPVTLLSNRHDEPTMPFDPEVILGWVTDPDRLEFVLHTIEENYEVNLRQHGEAKARRRFIREVILTFCTSVFALASRIAGFVYLLRKIGLF